MEDVYTRKTEYGHTTMIGLDSSADTLYVNVHCNADTGITEKATITLMHNHGSVSINLDRATWQLVADTLGVGPFPISESEQIDLEASA